MPFPQDQLKSALAKDPSRYLRQQLKTVQHLDSEEAFHSLDLECQLWILINEVYTPKVWTTYSALHFAELLAKQPQFVDRQPWVEVCAWQFLKLLSEQPQFVNLQPWVQVPAWQFAKLLAEQPQFENLQSWPEIDEEILAELMAN